jgi:hypothetical protein
MEIERAEKDITNIEDMVLFPFSVMYEAGE